jgi:hypothetical protein
MDLYDLDASLCVWMVCTQHYHDDGCQSWLTDILHLYMAYTDEIINYSTLFCHLLATFYL